MGKSRPVWSAPAFFVTLLLAAAGASAADEADAFFDDSKVHEIRLYFDDPNWYDTLHFAHDRNPADPYFPARFVYSGMTLDPVGVRFKGNSSFRIPSVKKGFKIDFNEYQEDAEDDVTETTFFGLKKLNLNNGQFDPTLLREKLFLDFAARYLPAIRAVHARVYVNDAYWGLYTAVEQTDMTFIRSRLGNDEDGNLFEGERSEAQGGGTFGSDLTYLGPDPEDYYGMYQLKSNEGANDWSDLAEFVDVLNNTPAQNLPERLEPICDVENVLFGMALNNLFVNLDSYAGSAHNYYLYDRDSTGRFIHIHWDTNETFGTFKFGTGNGDEPLRLPLFWTPSPRQGQPQRRPLMENLWAVDAYRQTYLRQVARMLREGFDPVTMNARIQELANMIRADVYADQNKPRANADFETALSDPYMWGNRRIFGLLQFVTERVNYLRPILQSSARSSDVRLNELMTVNTSTLADGAGDYDPWIELHNLGPGQVGLTGFYLTDDDGNQRKWALPARRSPTASSWCCGWMVKPARATTTPASASSPAAGASTCTTTKAAPWN